MMQKIFLISPVLFCLTIVSLFAAEDRTLTLDSIHIISDGAYSLSGKNIPSDSNLLNVYINDVKIDPSHIYLNKDSLDVRNFYPITWSFVLERMRVEYGSGDIANYISDQKSEAIRVRKTSNIGFNGQVLRQSKNGYDVITLPFTSSIPALSSFGQSQISSEKKIVINGQEQPLTTYADDYKDGVYYITADGITFIEKNLTERLTTIGLKTDGLSSNYVTVKKEWIILDNPSHVEIEDVGTTKNLKMYFSIPSNFTNLLNKEIWINGAKIDNTQASIGLGQFIIRYDLSKLPSDQDTISVILKDTNTNQFSDEKVINVSGFSKLTIDSIDTGNGNGPNFTFTINGNINALIGDVYKFKININGTDYTRDGIQEVLKDASGAVQKDSSGNDRYATKNKIEFRKTGQGIEFDFFYSQLQDGENILYIKNDNTGRESNKVSFSKKGGSSVSYSYMTWASIAASNTGESLSFEPGVSISKNMNPISMTTADLNISLGKIQLSNLRNDGYYNLNFTMDTNLRTNPFSSLTLDTVGLEAVKNGNTISFIFHKQGFWKDFKATNELIGRINDVLNIGDTPFTLKISEISLSKLMGDNSYGAIATLKNALSANASYLYTDSSCFDGTKDTCSLGKEQDPLLSLAFSASGSLVSTGTLQGGTVANTGSLVTTVEKKNITSIVVQDFWNSKFQKVQDVLIKKYDNLKKKGSRYLPTFRKATNDILRALKSFELRVDMTESMAQVKSSLGILNEVLRQARNE